MWMPTLILLAAPAADYDDPLPKKNPEVTRDALEHHMRFLASDELLGRLAGTPESARTSAYLASALERAGVQPAGVDGSFFQPVPLIITRFEATPVLQVGERKLERYGTDFSVRVMGDPKNTEALKVLAVNEYEDLPEEADPGTAIVLDKSKVRRWLSDRGHENGAGWGLVVRADVRKEEGRALSKPTPVITGVERWTDDFPEQVTVYGELAEALLAGKHDSIQLTTNGSRARVNDRNVVGLVRGVGTEENPELASEVIVLSAHFDHVGVKPGDLNGEEDLIFNGADDDASGTAVLLELAEAFAGGKAPARTVLFLFCAAEEEGMIGTYYWADNPTVPIEDVVCNLNFELLGMPDPIMDGPGHPWLTGYERSNLGPLFNEHGLKVGEDRRLEQGFFFRSDNIVFVKKGIVGQTLSTGGANPNYHQVTDEYETMDFAHMTTCAELAMAASRLLADAVLTPEWNEGEPKLGR